MSEPKKKRQVIVVKKIEKVSPKKDIYITRKLKGDEEYENLETSKIGNSSPQHPISDASGHFIRRSILGDPKVFDRIESENEEAQSVPQNTVQTPPRSRTGLSPTASWKSLNSGTLSKKSHQLSAQGQAIQEPINNQDVYLQAIKKFQEKAKKTKINETIKEQNLVQFLPVNERFNINKEGKVLALWQERQKTWEKIQKHLSTRVGKDTTNLMMNTGDEFRARNEEYDIIQAAMPAEEHFGSNVWKMTLRGGDDTSVSIGHIFSGLSCNVSTKFKVPTIIRKPKPKGTIHLHTTFIDETPALLKRKKLLQAKLQTLRPKDVGPSDVDGLTITSQDLFEWTLESSKQHFKDLEKAKQNEELKDRLYFEQFNKELQVEEQQAALASAATNVGPKINFLSSRNVVFTALQREIVRQHVVFRNTGCTALTYTWRRLPEVDPQDMSQVATAMNKRDDTPREHLFCKQRSVFFCGTMTGQCLPGETVETIFSFCCKASGGVFNENWILDTTPKAAVSYDSGDASATFATPPTPLVASAGGASTQQQIRMPTSVAISLRGHVHTLDETTHRRDVIRVDTEKSVVEAFIRDDIYNIIDRIRTPVTYEILTSRKLKLFNDINMDLVISNNPILQGRSELYVTQKMYQKFFGLHDAVNGYVRQVLDELYETVIYSRSESKVVVQEEALSLHKELTLNPALKNEVDSLYFRNILFPEKKLDDFDEVNEGDLLLTWDLNVMSLMTKMEVALDACEIIHKFQDKITEDENKKEKQRIRAAKKAAAGSDDEDEEEEETEDSPEDGEAVVPPVHPQLLAGRNLLDSVKQTLFQLALRPIPAIDTAIKESLVEVLDRFDDMKAQTLAKLGIPLNTVIPTVKSAFVDPEGVEFWTTLLQEPNAEGKDKNSKAPAKPPAKAPAKGAKGAEEQRNQYYKAMYDAISSALLDGVLGHVSNDVGYLCESDKDSACKYPQLSDAGTIRREDFTQVDPFRPVFVCSDGSPFCQDFPKSAFDTQLAAQRKTIKPIVQMSEWGGRLFVYLFSKQLPSYTSDDTNYQSNLLRQALNTVISDNLKKKKSKQISLPTEFDVKICSNIASLKYQMNDFISNANNKDTSKATVFFMNNIAFDDVVVPRVVEYTEVLSDDEDCPIPIGLAEYKESLIKSHYSSNQVQTVQQTIEVDGKKVHETCHTNVITALSQLVNSYKAIWLDNCTSYLFDHQHSTFNNLDFQSSMTRLLSPMVREIAVWGSVISNFRKFQDHTENGATTVSQHLNSFMQFLYPPKTCPHLKCLFTLGGTVRLEKFILLNEMLDIADVIFIGGEMSLPFISCMHSITINKKPNMTDYRGMCAALILKARVKCVKFIIPVDIVCGDEEISQKSLEKCYINFDSDTRDEGGDYEGESKVQVIDDSTRVLNSYVYDIGPVSTHILHEELNSTNLHFNWGLMGCSELSAFQSGQKGLVKNSLNINNAKRIDALHSIVIGESSVEWWARISDPEGEAKGDIVKRHNVVFCCRDSSALVGLLCNLRCVPLQQVHHRPNTSDEWDYISAARVIEVDPEDEEEDEEEEDD